MKLYTMILVTMTVLAGQASAQQTAPQTDAMVVKEPVFQTNGPYKVQEMMEPSLARHTVYRPIDLKAVKGKLPIMAFGNGGCVFDFPMHAGIRHCRSAPLTSHWCLKTTRLLRHRIEP
jgi:hypothetical protein